MPTHDNHQPIISTRDAQLEAFKRQVSRIVVPHRNFVALAHNPPIRDLLPLVMSKLSCDAAVAASHVRVADVAAPPNTPSGSSCESEESACDMRHKKPYIHRKSASFDTAASDNGVLPSTWRRQLYIVWIILFFMVSSLGAIFINKTCLTGYHFRYPLTMMLLQMASAIALLGALHMLGYNRLPQASNQDLAVLIGPTVLFISNIVVGLSALSLVNIPMFSAFRRITLLFVMVAEYFYLKKTHSRAIVYTVIVMTVGAFISAVDDVSFSRLGYCLVFVNNVLTAAYLASIKNAMKVIDFGPLDLLYYTALMGLPLVTTMVISTGEMAHVIVAFRTQSELLSWGFMTSLFLTAMGAFAVNYSTSLCTDVTSPLTTSVAGQVKNVLQTILGFFSWGFVPTTMNTVGLMIALCAQVFFAYLKYKEQAMNMWKPVPAKDLGGDSVGSSCALQRDHKAEIQITEPNPVGKDVLVRA